MNRPLPVLTKPVIEAELARMCRKKRKHHLFAFYGEGSDQVVDLPEHGRFFVHPVASELALRELMPELENGDEKMVFLVPWTGEVPIDLAGRFVLNGKVRRIGRETRLKQLFGTAEVDERALHSALADYLLDQDVDRRLAIKGNRLTRTAMWTAWLKEWWKVPVDGELALDQLLVWAASDSHGPRLKEAIVSQTDDALAASLFGELYDVLDRAMGPTGPVVFKLWELGQGHIGLELALLFEPLSSSDDPAVAMWVRQTAKRRLPLDKEENADAVATVLGGIASLAFTQYRQRAKASDVRRIIQSADAIPDETPVKAALESSQRLPSSWTLRFEKLGDLLEKSADKPSAKSVLQATELLRAISEHDLFKQSEQTRLVKRAEMTVRLLAWLSETPLSRLEGGLSADADVEILGRWYAEEGGYVDWARRVARGASSDVFDRGAQAVAQAADNVRQRLDRRFATSLVAWHEAGRLANQSTQVVPIDQCSKRIIAKFLLGHDERRLLVLLVDGMAWAQAVELLESAEHYSTPWAPLAWHRLPEGRIGSGAYPTMLAALPSLTHVSRAAFFAGKPIPAGTTPDTAKDVERWRLNKHLTPFFEGRDAPRLLLRAEGHTPDGSASNEALNLVRDENKRVVAMVINAVDASLSGDSQTQHRWTIDTIRSLASLLDAARDAGRSVLLASDHGHVRSDCINSIPAKENGGARWRPLFTESESTDEYEVRFNGKTVWTPKGATGIALLADDTVQYGGGAQAGSHGGASLAEVIAPCVLIGHEDIHAAADDDALRIDRAFVPGWWHYDTRKPERKAAPAKKRKTPKEPESPQLEFSILAPKTEAPSAQPGEETEASSPLAESPLFKEQTKGKAKVREQVLKAVTFLSTKNGVSTSQAFASAMGEFVFRVDGLIASLQEVLNIDGYPVLEFDRSGDQVTLDKEKLNQQFEVTL